MIHATLAGDVIHARADETDDDQMQSVPGAARSLKRDPRLWVLPINDESISALRSIGALASRALVNYVRRKADAIDYIERMRAAEAVEPLGPPPVAGGVMLYQHQIRAYNIALALFGYDVGGDRPT